MLSGQPLVKEKLPSEKWVGLLRVRLSPHVYLAKLSLNEITAVIRPLQTNFQCHAAVCMQVPIFVLITFDGNRFETDLTV